MKCLSVLEKIKAEAVYTIKRYFISTTFLSKTSKLYWDLFVKMFFY